MRFVNRRWAQKPLGIAGCLLATMTLLAVACAPQQPVAKAPPQANKAKPEIQWAPCTDSDVAQCAQVPLPLDHADPAGGTLQVSVRRILSPNTAQKDPRQLWYLAGGPGASGTSILDLLHGALGSTLPNVDWYALDHRGTGGTARLSCPDQEKPGSPGGLAITPGEFEACLKTLAQHGALEALTTTASSQDLGSLIEALRGDAKVVIWGNSYGTYWAQRYLQLYPSQPDAVLLEALVPAQTSYQWFDHWMNETGLALMDLCAAQEACSQRFAQPPREVAKALPGRLASGHCSELKLPVKLSWVLGSLLYDHDLRELIPAIVHRLDRCNADDVQAITRLVSILFKDNGMLFAGDFSTPLYTHVVFSEIWDYPTAPTPKNLHEVAQDCLFCPADRSEMAQARKQWPAYPPDTHDNQFPAYKGPLLMLQGKLDPAVSPHDVAQMKKALSAKGQHFVHFPTGGHSLVGKTPLPQGGDCALNLLKGLLASPTKEPDTACVQNVEQPRLDGTSKLAAPLLGEGGAWGSNAP